MQHTLLMEHRPIVRESVSAERIASGDVLCNTSNLWPDGVKPDDYDAVTKACGASRWMPYTTQGHVSSVRRVYGCRQLCAMQDLYRQYGRWMPRMDDAVELFAAANRDLEEFLGHAQPFVRGEDCSLKYGYYFGPPTGPRGMRDKMKGLRFSSVTQVAQALITSPSGHSPMVSVDMTCEGWALDLWCVPWVHIVDEFRVFVHEHRTTCISQQVWHAARVLDPPADGIVQDMAHEAEGVVKGAGLASAVVDVALLNDVAAPVVYVIELNPFGAAYSSGSALFEWVRDAEHLTARDGPIVVRTSV